MQTCVNSKIWILCSWVRESWINVYNCPTRCDYLQFYYIFCRQLYMFRMIPSSIIRSTLKTVITTSGTNRICYRSLMWRSRNDSSTSADGSKYVSTISRCYNYSFKYAPYDGWGYLPKHVELSAGKYKKKLYIVASRWTIIGIFRSPSKIHSSWFSPRTWGKNVNYALFGDAFCCGWVSSEFQNFTRFKFRYTFVLVAHKNFVALDKAYKIILRAVLIQIPYSYLELRTVN
jgi:hypothetical protein